MIVLNSLSSSLFCLDLVEIEVSKYMY